MMPIAAPTLLFFLRFEKDTSPSWFFFFTLWDITFFLISVYFDVLILKIIFLKKNIILMHFQVKIYFEKQAQPHSQTRN
jgi:hypothetical protein